MPSMQKGDSSPSLSCFMHSCFMSHFGQILLLNCAARVSKRLFSFRVSKANFKYLPSGFC
jgi:hypothetical protein